MNLRNSPFVTVWGRGASIALVVFSVGSLLIAELGDHLILRKELFYSWLLVFFNAYIGTFIANQAVKCGFPGFCVWAFMVNGFRIAAFLIVLLTIVDRSVVNVRGFALITFFGYFAFLAAEVHGLYLYTKRISQDPQYGKKR